MTEVILKTPRLLLLMWDQGDAPLIQQLHSTLATTRFMSGRAPWSIEKCEERLAQWSAEHARYGTTKYKLLSAQDGRFLGRAGISPHGAHSSEFELGYALCEKEWGQGYASEIAAALIAWFFKKALAPRLTAFTHPENIASQRVLTKIGMRPIAPKWIDDMEAPTFEISAQLPSS